MLKTELLAPAGDLESAYAALYYGADALYLGLKKFSARATAVNFDANDLNQITAYAHFLKRKVYVTINTVLQEAELPDLLEMLDICANSKVDAVILQDLGVLRVLKENYPQIEAHASTQMAVHNKEGALFLKKMGFSRVVLARELTLKEIEEISAVKGLETEVFVHGALCYSYSGLCQFSALEYERSANRGKCIYPCRALFETKEGTKHCFSMKDMALGRDILKLKVSSLKIEGRKKSALYVAAVTDYYRHILDGKGADTQKAENIKQIFSRPWCQFHFNGKDKNVVDVDFVGHRGLKIGEIEQIAQRKIIFKTNHLLERYDGIQIDVKGFEKPFGFSVQGLKVNHKNVYQAKTGETVEVELPLKYPDLKRKMLVYLASSGFVKGLYDYQKPKPNEFGNKTAIEVEVKVSENRIEALSGKYKAEVFGCFEPAKDVTKVKEALENAFSKTGGTAFEVKSLTINNPKELFVPVSAANELRRQLLEKIVPVCFKSALPKILPVTSSGKPGWIIKTDRLENLSLLDVSQFAEIIYLLNPASKLAEIASLPKNKVRLALPTVCRKPEIFENIVSQAFEAGYKKWEVANWWALEMLHGKNADITFDSPLYMLNSQAMTQAKKIGAGRVTLSVEDTKTNIQNLLQNAVLPTVLVVYQDAPLFTSAVCIRSTDCKHCDALPKWISLKKNGESYDALSQKCQLMLFDRRPLGIVESVKGLNPAFYRADFCYKSYTAELVKDITEKLMRFEHINGTFQANFLKESI